MGINFTGDQIDDSYCQCCRNMKKLTQSKCLAANRKINTLHIFLVLASTYLCSFNNRTGSSKNRTCLFQHFTLFIKTPWEFNNSSFNTIYGGISM